jgi:hypothetical protein
LGFLIALISCGTVSFPVSSMSRTIHALSGRVRSL